MKKVTVKDIARELNVSIGTVDRALHNRKDISESTKKAVLDKAQEMGYEINKFAQSLSRKRKIVIGCVFPGDYKYFYPDVQKGVNSAENELKDFNVKVMCKTTEHLEHVDKEIEMINELVEEKVDGLMICPGHYSKLNKAINDAAKKGIPVVTVATDAPDSKRKICVSTNSYNNGQIAGGLMADFVNGAGQIAIMTGSNDVNDHIEKVKGFKDAVQKYSSIKIVEIAETADDENLVYHAVKNTISKYPDLKGIYFNTVNNAFGCKAVSELGKDDRIKLVGTDLIADNLQYIKSGVLNAVIYQNPFEQGRKSIIELYNIITTPNYSYSKKLFIKPEIITRHNVEYYKVFS